MPVEPISKSVPSYETNFFQTKDHNGSVVRVTRQQHKDADGKPITKDYGNIQNPNGSDIKTLLEKIQGSNDASKENDIFNLAMKHLDKVDSGKIKPVISDDNKPKMPDANKASDAPKTPDIMSNKKAVNDDYLHNLKFPPQGMTVSPKEMTGAMNNMRKDIKQ